MTDQKDVKSELLHIAQIATIAVISELTKDGFQPSDLLAPLKSPEFRKKAGEVAEDLLLTFIECFKKKG